MTFLYHMYVYNVANGRCTSRISKVQKWTLYKLDLTRRGSARNAGRLGSGLDPSLTVRKSASSVNK